MTHSGIITYTLPRKSLNIDQLSLLQNTSLRRSDITFESKNAGGLLCHS